MSEKYVVNGDRNIAGVELQGGAEVAVTNPGRPGKVNVQLGGTTHKKLSTAEWKALLEQGAVFRQQ